MRNFLHYGRHWLDRDDIEAVTRVLESAPLTRGEQTVLFEQAVADYVGAEYCVAVSSGTAALLLAVKALAIEKGMKGITSPISFLASANCLVHNDLTVDFADIEEINYCISPAEIEKKMDDRTAVVIPVHFAGVPADIKSIAAAAQEHDVYIIEDAAHALGSRYPDGRRVGCCRDSHMTVFSFHPVKTIATGEGGAVTTNDRDLYEKLKRLRNHGITKDPGTFRNRNTAQMGPWYYEMQAPGYNYHLTDIQAALGLSQLRKIEGFIKRRREIFTAYNDAFGDLNWLETPVEPAGVYSAFHLYVVRIDFEGIGKDRRRVMEQLQDQGIGTQVHYIPLHMQPYFRETFGFREGEFPVAEQYYRRCLTLPLFPRMTDGDVDRVITAVNSLNESR